DPVERPATPGQGRRRRRRGSADLSFRRYAPKERSRRRARVSPDSRLTASPMISSFRMMAFCHSFTQEGTFTRGPVRNNVLNGVSNVLEVTALALHSARASAMTTERRVG